MTLNIRTLSSSQRDVIAGRHLDAGEKQSDVARDVGLNAQQVNRLITELRLRRENGKGPSRLQLQVIYQEMSDADKAVCFPSRSKESEPVELDDRNLAEWLSTSGENDEPVIEDRDEPEDVEPEPEAKADEDDEAAQEAQQMAEAARISRCCRDYIEHVGREQLLPLIAKAGLQAEDETGLDRLELIQHRRNLEGRYTTLKDWPDERVAEAEQAFAEHGAVWCLQSGITVPTLVEYGIPRSMLRRAGVSE